jgi:hypothetical protein
MKSVKVSEATGTVLDWMVCIAEGLTPEDLYISRITKNASIYRRLRDDDGKLTGSYMTGPDLLFSRKWEAGGPIIGREDVEFVLAKEGGHHESAKWMAVIRNSWFGFGEEHLIAAMRCYATSKLGDTVEVPEEFT